MTSTVEPADAAPPAPGPGPYDALRLDLPARRRLRDRGRRFWSLVAVVVVLVVGGAITAVAVSFHYLHAPALESDGGGWAPPDNIHERHVQIGGVGGQIVEPRLGQRMSFDVFVTNRSSVTQTFLGGADERTDVADPMSVAISTVDVNTGDDSSLHYTTRPVDIVPGGTRDLRVTVRITRTCWPAGQASYYDQLRVRVRVGWFTRIETIDMNNLVMEIQATKTVGNCP